MGITFSCCGITCCRKEKKALDARVSQNRIGEVYDRIAPIYDIWGKLTESHARSRAIALAEIKDGQSILGIGVKSTLDSCFVML